MHGRVFLLPAYRAGHLLPLDGQASGRGVHVHLLLQLASQVACTASTCRQAGTDCLLSTLRPSESKACSPPPPGPLTHARLLLPELGPQLVDGAGLPVQPLPDGLGRGAHHVALLPPTNKGHPINQSINQPDRHSLTQHHHRWDGRPPPPGAALA